MQISSNRSSGWESYLSNIFSDTSKMRLHNPSKDERRKQYKKKIEDKDQSDLFLGHRSKC